MPVSFMKGSFASGELSPYLYARVDFPKYYSGAKELMNVFVHPQGGLSNRAGLRFVAKTKYPEKKARLIDFIFDRTENYVLEFGEGYIRFITDGGLITVDGNPYELETQYAEADLPYIRTVQSSDTLFIFCQDKKPMRLIRYTHTSWLFQEFPFKLGPFLQDRDVDCKVRVVLDEADGASSGSQTFDQPGDYVFTVPAGIDALDITLSGGGGSPDITTITIAATNSRFDTFVARASNTGIAENVKMSAVPVTAQAQLSVTVGAGAEGRNEEGEIISGTDGAVTVAWKAGIVTQTTGTLFAGEDIFTAEHVGALWKLRQSVPAATVSHPDSSAITCYDEWFLETSGYWAGTLYVQKYDEDNDTWETIRTLTSSKDKNYSISGEVEGTTKIRLYSSNFVAAVPEGTKADSYLLGKALLQTKPTIYDGVVKITQYTNAREVKVSIQKDIAVPDAWTALWYEGAWSAVQGFPSCGGFYQDRLCAGGTKRDPFMFFTSEPGDYINFNTSLPVEDSDGILARILARQNGRIREIVPANDLLILTDVGEFKLSASDKGALSPKNVDVKPQSNRGCAIVDPVLIGNQLVFVQAGGSIVRDFGYTLDVDGYAGNDLTVLASHFFEDKSIVDMDYQGNPDSIVWCVRDDGVLLGLTYMKEQEVFAWHKHTTQGRFESVAALPTEKGYDEVYFVVERDGVRYIECMSERLPESSLQRAFFVDCGLSYTGEPVTKVGGLDHLAGRTVAILADGAIVPRQEVRQLEIGGNSEWGVELDHPASSLSIGLPYTAIISTLNIELSETGALQSKKKHIPNVVLRVHQTVGGKVGVDDEALTPIKWNRMDDPLSTQPYLFTGDREIKPFSGYRNDGCIKIVQDEPLPITVLGVIPTVEARS